MPKILNTVNKIAEVCKTKGFLLERYCKKYEKINYDYGPLGLELKKNVLDRWWHEIVTSRDNIHGVEVRNTVSKDGCINNDYFDHKSKLNTIFNHGIHFIKNNVYQLPFGLAQYSTFNAEDDLTMHNEWLSLGLQHQEYLQVCFFCSSNTMNYWMDYWMRKRSSWWKRFADIPASFVLTEYTNNKMFGLEYGTADDSVSLEFNFPWGKEPIECISSYLNTKQFDQHGDTLVNDHMDDLALIVTNLSVEKGIFAYLLDAFQEKDFVNSEENVTSHKILRLHPVFAPIKVAVVVQNEENNDLCRVGQQLATEIRQAGIASSYIGFGDIPNCYINQDEIGTPYCVTIESTTLTNGVVTLRNRDTTLCEYLHISEILKTVQRHLDSF